HCDRHAGRGGLRQPPLSIGRGPGPRRHRPGRVPLGDGRAPVFCQEDRIMSNGLQQLRTTFGKALIGILWSMAAFNTAISVLHSGTPLLTAALGVILAASATLFWRHDPTGPLTRYVSSSAVSAMVALLVLEFSRHAFQIDMHMAFFAGLAIV